MTDNVNVFDIDAEASQFEPVRIKFRGRDLVLGDTAVSIIQAASLYSAEDDEQDHLSLMVKYLRPVLRALNPELAQMMEEQDLTSAEELALMRPVTAVMERLGKLTFRSEG